MRATVLVVVAVVTLTASVSAQDQRSLPAPSAFKSLTFGVAKLPELQTQGRMTHQGWRTVRPTPTPSPQPARAHRPGIDCAMAKPADPHLDHRMLREPPKHVQHSGIIKPIAPCR